jgi:hypothetical protein
VTETLRDRFASALGPGNDDATAYAQADSVLEILQQWNAENAPHPTLKLPLDLRDPIVENEVADAIRRLSPEGWVPLHVRYPWRFDDRTAGSQEATLLDVVIESLRASADVHEAERIPHLVGPLREIAIALERGGLVPGPLPGRCPEQSPELRYANQPAVQYTCELLAKHAGLHEATTYPVGDDLGITPTGKTHWATVDRTNAEREHLLTQISAVWGAPRVDDALRLAIEAGKYALGTEQIGPILREHAFLQMAGALPEEFEQFTVWALRLGLITQKQIDEGRALDLLGMRGEEPPAPDWDEERSHLVIEDDEGKPFLSGCDCEIGRDHYATETKP